MVMTGIAPVYYGVEPVRIIGPQPVHASDAPFRGGAREPVNLHHARSPHFQRGKEEYVQHLGSPSQNALPTPADDDRAVFLGNVFDNRPGHAHEMDVLQL